MQVFKLSSSWSHLALYSCLCDEALQHWCKLRHMRPPSYDGSTLYSCLLLLGYLLPRHWGYSTWLLASEVVIVYILLTWKHIIYCSAACWLISFWSVSLHYYCTTSIGVLLDRLKGSSILFIWLIYIYRNTRSFNREEKWRREEKEIIYLMKKHLFTFPASSSLLTMQSEKQNGCGSLRLHFTWI